MDAGRPALTRWLGVLADPAEERAFQEDLQPRLAAQLRYLAYLPGLYVAASVYDYHGFGPGRAFLALAVLRWCVWGLVALGGARAHRGRSLRGGQLLLFAGLVLALATEVVEYHLSVRVHGPPPPHALPFLVLFVLGVYMMLPLPPGLSLAAAGAGSAGFLAYLAVTRGPWAAPTGLAALYLLFANGVGLGFRATWNRIQRREFALRARLQREIAEREAAQAARGRFLATISHELRTPLNGVLGGAELLRADPGRREALDLVARNGELLARMLEDLLDLSRLEAGRLAIIEAPFNLDAVLAGVEAAVAPEARAKGLDLRLGRTGEVPPPLRGDALRLRQVLANLAGNAVKFTDRGRVEVTVAVAGSGDRVACAFEVADTGPGVAPADRARVFEAFEQAGPARGGAGLGLAICRDLVAAMGGDLVLDSEPGRGCRFRFRLDLAPAAAPAPAGALEVLVVDDVEANRIVAEGLLGLLGHHSAGAADAGRALALLETGRFQAVLLDLRMGGEDGLETLRRIRAHPDPKVGEVAVFLCSADTGQRELRAGAEAGIAGVLPKPVRREQLEALLGHLPGPGRVDEVRVARLRADLGEAVWRQGVAACLASAEACLDALDGADAGPALHRLAGLAASYGLVDLARRARWAEADLAAGGPGPDPALRVCAQASLARLQTLA